ncbi:CASP-like protein 4A3 [Silene latifolia]|uniref:CASP-like protein 4A3 n=1 Tax=Silene latifolia TaxID=37657 RepID=UPI003D77FAAD
MHKYNNNNHHHNNNKPPRPPPLAVSLPSPTRPKPVLKPANPNDDDKPHIINDTALVPSTAVEKYYSPLTSPLPATPPQPPPPPPPHQVVHFSRREDPPANSAIVYGGGGGVGEGKVRGVRFGGVEDVVTRSKKEVVVKKVGLGMRVLEIVFCVISFSIMATDKTQGWTGDSFDRYKEYRFCLAVAVFGFVYSAFQAYDLGSYMATGKHVIRHRFSHQFNFFMDQILAYLLISAASASASRVDNWQQNWGKDEFTEKATASISMAFLAFICFAMSSLISGYNLCHRDSY